VCSAGSVLKPVNLKPPDAEYVLSPDVPVSWHPGGFPTTTPCLPKSYQLEVSTSPTFASITIAVSGETGSPADFYRLTGLADCTQYYWHVKASDGTSWSDFSAATSFLTAFGGLGTCPTSEPKLISSTAGAWAVWPATCIEGGASDSVEFVFRFPYTSASITNVSAFDGSTTFACEKTSVDGQAYCKGYRPSSPGALSVSVKMKADGSTQTHTFTEWPGMVPKGSCYIPKSEPLSGDICHTYPDEPTCNQYSQTCHWEHNQTLCVHN